MIESSLAGINGTVFMYGQTGAGKTYTMMGDYSQEKDTNPPSNMQSIMLRGNRTPMKKSNTKQGMDKNRTPITARSILSSINNSNNPARRSFIQQPSKQMVNEGVLILSLKDLFKQINKVSLISFKMIRAKAK